MQSGLWISPRVFVSTLHFHHWIQGTPSTEKCELIHKSGQLFVVGSETCSQIISQFSSKVQLIDFSTKDDLGVFKLQDQYPLQIDHVNPDWLLDRDELYKRDLKPGRKVACIGYKGIK
jgi:hypothetical protein